MLSHLARRSLLVTRRSYHVVRTVSAVFNTKQPQLPKYYVNPLANGPVYTACFRFTSDSKVTSGGYFCVVLFL